MNTLIVNDTELFSNGLSSLLNSLNKDNETTKCLNINEYSKYELHTFDLVIINIDLFSSTEEISKFINKFNKDCKIIAISNYNDSSLIKYCFNNNFYGFLLKTYTEEQFRNILNLIFSEAKYFPNVVLDDSHKLLTSKQMEIVKLVNEGCPNKEIAYRLNISECTVKVHMSNIFKKFGCYNRIQLINKGLIMKNH